MSQPTGRKDALVTAATYSSERFRLLELTPDVEKAIIEGERLTIVGGSTERAVLTTASKSFFLAKEDTSNLRMLTTNTKWCAPNDDEPTRDIVVDGAAAFHYVLQPKTADVSVLRALLLKSPFKKADSSASTASKRVKRHATCSLAYLMNTLQCSENEVREMLAELNAFEDGGAWHVLDPEYQAAVFADILDAIVQNDWDFENKGVALADVLRACDEPEVVVRQCCHAYGNIETAANGQELCRFDTHKVALFCARQLFRERGDSKQAAQLGATPGWTLDQFMEKWQLRVPEPIKVSRDMLRGIALTKTQRGKPTWLHYFPEDELPMDPKLRFERLFQQQEKWSVEQLEPYISALVRPGVTQASLLLKYARSSRQANSTERLYSKR
ncbi:hypothetical protein PINS_up005366 [Pythium insidiosum]|nr:hypothetical protein PINS_up005366 [Pythium insidiosum]